MDITQDNTGVGMAASIVLYGRENDLDQQHLSPGDFDEYHEWAGEHGLGLRANYLGTFEDMLTRLDAIGEEEVKAYLEYEGLDDAAERLEMEGMDKEKHMDTKEEAEKRAEAVRNGVKNVERAFIHKYVEPSDEEFQDEVFDVDGDEYWVPYTSPQGEDGWKSLEGDEIVFTDQPPGPTPVWVDRDEVTQDIAVEGERGEDEE